jgi:hypothetical protein
LENPDLSYVKISRRGNQLSARWGVYVEGRELSYETVGTTKRGVLHGGVTHYVANASTLSALLTKMDHRENIDKSSNSDIWSASDLLPKEDEDAEE